MWLDMIVGWRWGGGGVEVEWHVRVGMGVEDEVGGSVVLTTIIK